MRIFLTGATGFVGRNLLIEAAKSGRYSAIVAAVRDADKLRRQLAEEGIDPIEILPWDAPVQEDADHAVLCAGALFARSRDEYFRVNVDGTLRHLPRSARTLVLSSQAAGGPAPTGRVARSRADSDAPITWYGESKLEMERRVRQARPDAMIWRPPMILGPRDHATLPLFKMARGALRIKPGLAPKAYSWIAVQDLVRSILRALDRPAMPQEFSWNVCGPEPITDIELIETAAEVCGGRGTTVRLPHAAVRVMAAAVDAVPSLRDAVPSLTRDRVKDVFPDRWVIDGAEYWREYGPPEFSSLRDALEAARDWYRRAGLLP